MEALSLDLKNTSQIINLLKAGKIGVMPTDTIYGLLGSALNKNTVEEIYSLRSRSINKPMIILISSLDDLKKFDIAITKKQKDFLMKIWLNPISIVLPCPKEKFIYLHRGKNSLAFRMPKGEWLLKILEKSGPLVAPSANTEGGDPAESIDQAKKYFGDKISFYLDKGKVKSKPSKVVRLYEDGSHLVLRK